MREGEAWPGLRVWAAGLLTKHLLTTLSPTLGTPRGQDRSYTAQSTSGSPDSQGPLPLASSIALLNAHRLPWGSPGSLLGPAARARMKVSCQ